jgi:hypothetical protein
MQTGRFLVRLLLLSILSVGWLVLLIGVAWAFGARRLELPAQLRSWPRGGSRSALPICNMRDWQPEVAEAPYAEIDGDRVVIYNFRK